MGLARTMDTADRPGSSAQLAIVPPNSPRSRVCAVLAAWPLGEWTPDQVVNEAQKLGHVEGRGQEGLGSRVEGRLARRAQCEGGDGDHGRGGVELPRRPDDLQAISVREPKIGDDEPGPHGLEQSNALGAGYG